MNKIFPLLILLSLSLSALLIKEVSSLYTILILLGAYIFYINKYELSMDVKRFYVISLMLMAGITISAVSYDWHTLFQWRFQSIQLIVFAPLLYAVLMHCVEDEQKFWKLLVSASLFSTIWLVLIANAWPVQRDTGLLSVAISRGNMGMLFGIFSFVALFALSSNKWKLLAFVTFISGVLLSVLSGSRGGWLALLLSMITMTLILLRFAKYKQFYLLLLVQMSVLLLIAIFWDVLPLQSRLVAAVDNVEKYLNGNYETSVGQRFELWKAAWFGFLEHPLSGWGWTNFNEAHQFTIENELTRPMRMFGHPHNQFFMFLVETGFLTTLILIVFLLWPLWVGFKYLRDLRKLNSDQGMFLAVLLMTLSEAVIEFSLTDHTFSQKYFVYVFLVVSLAAMGLIAKKCAYSKGEPDINNNDSR